MIEMSLISEALHIRSNYGRELAEIELLLLARKIPYTKADELSGFQLVVLKSRSEFAMREISDYIDENQNWPPAPLRHEKSIFKFSWLHLLVWLAMAVFHRKTSIFSSLAAWREKGRAAAHLILEGEFYRTVTALTLHVDDAHMISNFVSLLFFSMGVNFFVGPGVSLWLILCSGLLGNYWNAMFYQAGHYSVGASTAVFGALGILGVFGARKYLKSKHHRKEFFIPIVAALGLFAVLGTSPDTDVMAHFFGLLAGVLMGTLFYPTLKKQFLKRYWVQSFFFLLFAGTVGLSWRMQLIN